MTTALTPSPQQQFIDANGDPLASGKVYTYQAGTTTPLATYTDASAGTANTYPIILNSAGRANIWLTVGSNYKFVVKDSADNTVFTVDNISSPISSAALAASGGSSLVGFLQSGSGAVARTAQDKMREWFTPEDFGCVGDRTTDDTANMQKWIDAAPLSGGGNSPGYEMKLTRGKTYKITAPLVIGNRRLFFRGMGTMGSGGGGRIYMATANTDIIDFTTGNSDTISFEGIIFELPASGTGNALVLGSAGQAAFDGRVTDCWFIGGGGKYIYAKNLQGFVLERNGFDSGIGNRVAMYIEKGSANQIVGGNRFYGQESGVVILEGEDNSIIGNHFDECTGDNDTTAAILINVNAAGGKVCRSTTIVGNSFRANNNDIILLGNGGLNGGNTGCNDTFIDGNSTDRPYRRFLLATDAHQTHVGTNHVNSPSQRANNTYPGIEINGTSDRWIIDGVKVSDQTAGSVVPSSGVKIGASTTNGKLTPNNSLTGGTGSPSAVIATGATFLSAPAVSGTFTPVLKGDATNGTITYTVQAGKFEVENEFVSAHVQLVVNAITVAPTGNILIDGLPFQSNTVNDGMPRAAAMGGVGGVTVVNKWIGARTSGANQYAVNLLDCGGGALALVQPGALAGGCQIEFSVRYRMKTGANLNAGCTVA